MNLESTKALQSSDFILSAFIKPVFYSHYFENRYVNICIILVVVTYL